MAYFKYLERLERMDRLIRMKNTGTPRAFADKLGISESHLYFCLKELKEYGLPISYNGVKRSYYYREDVKLRVSVSIQKMAEDEVIHIVGGIEKKSNFFAPLLYNQSEGTYFGT
ncbi:MAG: hypothetical protein V5A59_11445 [Bacteroidales bacterium]|nr:hypothetical protein [Bacteroidales bacterium]